MGEVATVITALAAAIAAVASWAAVAQNRRLIRAAHEPHLQVLIEGGPGVKRLGIQVRNSGGGTAKGLAIAVTIADDAKAFGRTGVGFLPPGDIVHVRFATPPPPEGQVQAVCVASDPSEFVHAWNHVGEHETFRTRLERKPREISLGEAFAAFFPDIETEGRDHVAFEWTHVPMG